MIVTAWNNGKHYKSGAGYGLKIKIAGRDENFFKDWGNIIIYLEGFSNPFEVNINKLSFWSLDCRELINKDIGLWLLENKKAPWPKGNPPKIKLEKIKDNIFEASFL